MHGGGYSGLTWALLNEEITRLVECHTLSIDLRGHGSSKTDDDYDLSAEVMAEDISNVVEEYVKLLTYTPEIVLIGMYYYLNSSRKILQIGSEILKKSRPKKKS